MEKRKKKDLESKGYKVGSVEEFLGLSTEESEYIELKLALSEALAIRRKKRNLTQAQRKFSINYWKIQKALDKPCSVCYAHNA